MKPRVRTEIDGIAAYVSADGWEIVREGKHLIIDFRFGARVVRQVLAATPSGPTSRRNAAAWLKRQVR